MALCDRFHITPGQARRLDAGEIRLLQIEALGRPRQEDTDG